jgi:phosphoribosylanthranilate isomerase
MPAGEGRSVRIRVKICGVTRPEWAVAAAEAGADAVGLVFAESPRRVTVAQAAEIVRALPRGVAPVGVFVDEEPGAILRLADEVGFGVVQLHGDEPPGVLSALDRLKVIKAFRVADEGDVLLAREWKQQSERLGQPADGYLVDARVAGGPKGGSGQLADWGLAARMIFEGFRPLVLAGGLSPDNVAEAIRAVRPWGVDGSSGLESAPGVKDPDKIRAFVAAVRGCTV